MQLVQDMADDLDEITRRVQDELLQNQQLMHHTTAEHQPETFSVGDYILVSTAHFETFFSRAIKKNRKLGPKFVGPFRIS